MEDTYDKITPIIALDCEMVDIDGGFGKTEKAVARVSIVNYNGHVLMDNYYRVIIYV